MSAKKGAAAAMQEPTRPTAEALDDARARRESDMVERHDRMLAEIDR